MDKIDGKILRGMLESANCNLNNHKEEINSLNVFPVPDGDTGTNMSMTFNNGMTEVRKSGSEQLSVVAKTASRGMLMGARGNSGVILSQIFRGISQAVGDHQEMQAADLSKAIFNGALLAYKAVMRPTEGTILTVVRESSEYADLYIAEHPETSVEEYFDMLCKEAKASLDRTPELLPILKEARVVDSGGCGLLIVFEGFKAFIDGNPITEATEQMNAQSLLNSRKTGYNAEFILRLSEQGSHLFKEEKFRKSMGQLGEDITVVLDRDLVKYRLHTMTPGEALNLGQRYGEFDRIQIDNAEQEQHPSIMDDVQSEEEPTAESKEYGIIAVAAGDGLKKLFAEYRTDVVVSGGQTMNPSTEDFVSAISHINAKHIFILPNNSNIIMAANAAADVTENKDIRVIPTTSIPQGLSACINFNPEDSVENNLDAMNAAVKNVVSGQVTYAVKDTTFDGQNICKGDYMGIFGKKIAVVTKEKVSAAQQLIDQMCSDSSEIVTLIKGEDATDQECQAVQDYIHEHFAVDIDVVDGGQPVYCFTIGVE